MGDEKVDKTVDGKSTGTWDTWKVTVMGTETEGATKTKVDGTFWLDKKDGSVVRNLSKLTDAVFPGGANAGVEIPPALGHDGRYPASPEGSSR